MSSLAIGRDKVTHISDLCPSFTVPSLFVNSAVTARLNNRNEHVNNFD